MAPDQINLDKIQVSQILDNAQQWWRMAEGLPASNQNAMEHVRAGITQHKMTKQQ